MMRKLVYAKSGTFNTAGQKKSDLDYSHSFNNENDDSSWSEQSESEHSSDQDHSIAVEWINN